MDTGKPTPLSAEEIAELRKLATEDPRCCGMIGGRWLLPALVDEVERARALLKRIEWQGIGTYDIEACPECGGFDPAHALPQDPKGHEPGCELAALIAGAPPAMSDADADKLLDAAAARAENPVKLK